MSLSPKDTNKMMDTYNTPSTLLRILLDTLVLESTKGEIGGASAFPRIPRGVISSRWQFECPGELEEDRPVLIETTKTSLFAKVVLTTFVNIKNNRFLSLLLKKQKKK